MRILFLGYSNLFQNELIPVINNLLEINEVHIAKFKNQEWNINHHKIAGKTVVLYPSYEEALRFADVDIAYISTVNSTHYELAKACLLKGWHTIIDKPITLNFTETEDLVKLSFSMNRLLAESLVYTYHPQYTLIKKEIEKFKIKNIITEFSIPPLDSYNFRYNKELGGGAINDMGPYAVSLGRYLFNEDPLDIKTVITEKRNDVDISFSVMMSYPNDKKLFGFFGFTTEYINFMNIVGDGIRIIVEPVYTIPDDLKPKIKLISYNEKENMLIAENGNTFYLFFKDFFNAIKTEDFTRFSDTILRDAKSLELLRNIK